MSQDTENQIPIPKEFLNEIQAIFEEQAKWDMISDIAVAKIKKAINVDFDLSAGLAARLEAKIAVSEKSKAHDKFWSRIAEILPETKYGRWAVDTEEWHVKPSKKGSLSQLMSDD